MAEEALRRHQRDWDDLAEIDPLWAIASSPDKRFGGWELEEFFATGVRDLAPILEQAAALGRPATHGVALDFGCGVGRTARALAGAFDHVVGVDIAEAMIVRGRELNADVENLELVVNDGGDLDVLAGRRFDLVFTRVVLQHQPNRDAVRRYVEAFVAMTNEDGLVVFQLPVHIPWRYRLLVARRLYTALRRVGVPPRVLYERFRLHPISMLFVPAADIEAWVQAAGGSVLHAEQKTSRQGISHTTFFVAPAA